MHYGASRLLEPGVDFSGFPNDSKDLDAHLVLEVPKEDFSENANKISTFSP